MPAISLPAFLKIMTKGTPQKVPLYGRYLSPGGYNYYRHLQEGAHDLTVGGAPYAEVRKSIEDATQDHEQKYNLAGIKNCQKWLDIQKPSSFFVAPTAAVTSPEGYLSVRLEPEFGAVITGQRYIIQAYYAADTGLSKPALSLGTRMISKFLCVGEFADCKAGILDLRKKEIFAGSYDALAMDLMLLSEFAWADGFFKAQKQQATQVA